MNKKSRKPSESYIPPSKPSYLYPTDLEDAKRKLQEDRQKLDQLSKEAAKKASEIIDDTYKRFINSKPLSSYGPYSLTAKDSDRIDHGFIQNMILEFKKSSEKFYLNDLLSYVRYPKPWPMPKQIRDITYIDGNLEIIFNDNQPEDRGHSLDTDHVSGHRVQPIRYKARRSSSPSSQKSESGRIRIDPDAFIMWNNFSDDSVSTFFDSIQGNQDPGPQREG